MCVLAFVYLSVCSCFCGINLCSVCVIAVCCVVFDVVGFASFLHVLCCVFVVLI